MIAAPHYLLLVLAGVAAVAWGVPASQRLHAPWDSLAALLTLLGVLATMLGALLTVLPRFFLE